MTLPDSSPLKFANDLNKKLIISIGQDEFEGPNPRMYVTRVINLEESVKKKLMGNELKLELQKQIVAKTEEKKKHSLNIHKDEDNWLKKVEEESERVIVSKEYKVDEQPMQRKNIDIFDTRLKQIQSELVQKEKAFNTELEKLKYREDKAQKVIVNNLLNLKNHIVGRSNASTLESSGLGNYGKLYFTDYKNISHSLFETNKDRRSQRVKVKKFTKEDLLDSNSE